MGLGRSIAALDLGVDEGGVVGLLGVGRRAVSGSLGREVDLEADSLEVEVVGRTVAAGVVEAGR